MRQRPGPYSIFNFVALYYFYGYYMFCDIVKSGILSSIEIMVTERILLNEPTEGIEKKMGRSLRPTI